MEVTTLRRPLVPADFERMNLSREFWTLKVQGVPESVREVVTRYLVHTDQMIERGAGMLLSGPAGVGKSGAAALVCKEARSRGYTTFFIGIWELRESMRAKIMFDGDVSMLDRCREVDVLVLDGLRPEDSGERFFGARDIEELVVTRGVRKKVTVVTTRLNAPDIGRHFPGFLEAAQGCLVYVPMSGLDLRQSRSEELRRAVLGD
jgi:DNA replication protein DnaC